MRDAALVQNTVRERLDRAADLQALLGARGGVVSGVPAGAVSLLAWWLRERSGRHVLLVTAESERVYADCLAWDPQGRVALFPAADTPPFDRVPPSEEVTRRRIGTLAGLDDPSPA